MDPFAETFDITYVLGNELLDYKLSYAVSISEFKYRFGLQNNLMAYTDYSIINL